MLPVLGPLAKLSYSRKALIATVDAVCSVGAILVTRYFLPDDTTMTLAIIAILQPLVIVWINSIAMEDAAGKQYDEWLESAKKNISFK